MRDLINIIEITNLLINQEKRNLLIIQAENAGKEN